MTVKRWFAVLICTAFLGFAPVSPGIAQNAKSAAKPAVQAKKLTRKQAQDVLRAGYDLLKAKKTKSAIVEFSRALNSGALRRNEMAKALFYRGRAYRATKQPANAISDLTSALWLKGALSEAERKEALKERQLAYSDAGVGVGSSSFGQTIVQPNQQTTQPKRPVGTASTSRAVARPKPAQPSGWQTSTKPQPLPTTTGSTTPSPLTSATNGITSFFSGLFGSDQSGTAQSSATAQPTSGSTAWSSTVQPVRTSTRTARRTSATRSVPQARYSVQVASYRDRQQAQALARKLAAQHAPLLRGLKPVVEQQAVGNMGTFYHVRVRPFQSAGAPSPLCRKLLASGLDCLVTKMR